MSVPDLSAHFYSKNPQVPVLPGDMAVHGQEHDFLLVIFFSPAPGTLLEAMLASDLCLFFLHCYFPI